MNHLADTPIALVGLGALYPRSADLRSFWSNVVEAADCMQDVPESHWKLSDYYDPDPSAPDKTYARRGGFVPEIPFNPMEFGLPPNTLEVTDVLQLLSLVVAKQTFADVTGSFDRSRTGVVLGVTGANSLTQPLSARLQTPVLKEVVRSCGLSEEDAEQIALKFTAAYAPWEENSFPGMLGNVVAGRVANRFDLGGMNCTVDAACASSLAAVRMAVSELVSGRADMMITGGCDAENTILMYMCFSKTPAFSKSGMIRPFDESSDGTLIGEGIGMVALKRLADAERDGDRIYAVLRGIGTSSDGRFKSIYAPRREGQTVALSRAYEDARVTPDSVGLLECHGTGTSVGDLTELSALRDVFSSATDEKQFCAVGSVKSQIGHTKGAAGAAGMIKVALSLYQKVLPPTINVSAPREAVDFPNSPFYVNSETRPWLLTSARPVRRAALSSFGFGGTNFHCVLEEHTSAVRTLHRTEQVRVWHAPDVAALLTAVEAHPSGMASEVPASHARLAVVGDLADQAISRLRASSEAFELPGVYFAPAARELGKIAALFAGQGSQYVGMGLGAALSTPDVRAELDAMSLAAGSLAIYPRPAFSDAERAEQETCLRRTENAQPAIGALSAGQFRFLRSLGLRVDGAVGHSFGELTALWAAGSLSDVAFRELAVARGAAMAAVVDGDPGTMAAVLAAPADLPLDAHPDVVVCNLNAPSQTVVGGGTAAVRAFVEAVRADGVEAQLLPVSAAFHTSHVAHAVPAFRSAVSAVEVGEPGIDVFPNTTGASYGTDVAANRNVLVDQLLNPVAFEPRLREMFEAGYRTFVEFGPKSVLSGLVRKTLGDDVTVLSADGRDSDRALKQLVARLIVLGVPLTDVNRQVAPLPAAPEQKGMQIPLSGVNHVPEARRRAYQDALANGYRVHTSDLSSLSSTVEPTEVEKTMHRAANEPVPATVGGAASEHLALHREYLNSQLRVAERVSEVFARHAEGGVPADNVISGITAVTDHGVAIGQSHAHANEVLRAFAFLEAGAPVEYQSLASQPAVQQHVASARPEITAGLAQVEYTPAPVVNGNGHANGYGHNAGYGHSTGYANGHHGSAAIAPGSASTAPAGLAGSASTAGPAQTASAYAAAPAPTATPGHAATPAPSPGHTAGPAPSPDAAPAGEPAPSAEVTVEAARTALLEIVAEKTGYPADMIDPGMDVEADLGIDSIKRVEIMGALRDRFPGGAMPQPEQMGELRTLDDIAGLIAGAAAAGEVASAPKADGATGISRMPARLISLPAPDMLLNAYAERPVALVAGDADDLADSAAHALLSAGWSVHIATLPHDLSSLDLVLDFAVRPAGHERLVDTLMLAGRTQALLEQAGERAAFVTVTRLDGTLGYRDGNQLGGVSGLVKTLAIESPKLFCRTVDLSPGLDHDRAVELLIAELHDPDAHVTQVGISDNARVTVGLEEGISLAGDEAPAPNKDDLFVVTGGARGVTAACVIGLARKYQPGLLLIGRTPLTDEPAWAHGIPLADLKKAAVAELKAQGGKPTPRDVERIFLDLKAQREVKATLQEIREAGSAVEYLAFDVTDADAISRLKGRDITGVVHGAGVLADQLIKDKQPDDVRRVLDVKLAGLHQLLAVLDHDKLEHVVLFSSVAGFFGNRGQSDYAMANEALNRIAVGLRRPGRRVTSVNWGAWAGGMVTPELQRMFAERGVPLIPLDRGVELFVEQFERNDGVCVIGPDSPLSRRDTQRRHQVLRRDIGTLPTQLGDHALDGWPVLPATAAVGAILRAVSRTEQREAGVVRNFSVLSGLVLDPAADAVEFELTPTAEGTEVLVKAGRPRYRAEVLTGAPAKARISNLPDPQDGEPANAYDGGALFHGPSLQGIQRVLEDGQRLVLGCQLPANDLGNGAYGTAHYDPLAADLLLQAALLKVFRGTRRPSLPSAIGEVEVHHRLPANEPFLVVVEEVRESLPTVRCQVTACAPDGTVLLRFRDVEVVTSAALATKFA